MEGIDKVWATLGRHPVIWHSWNTLVSSVSECVLVVRVDCLEAARSMIGDDPRTVVIAGGTGRQESVALGLQALTAVDIVAVHDVARPLVSGELLHVGVRLARLHGAAVPVVPVADTVKRIDDEGGVIGTIDRDRLRGAQTPQVFLAPLLFAAHASAGNAGLRATDDASLVQDGLHRPATTFPGSQENFKITTAFDLQVARLLMASGVPT